VRRRALASYCTHSDSAPLKKPEREANIAPVQMRPQLRRRSCIECIPPTHTFSPSLIMDTMLDSKCATRCCSMTQPLHTPAPERQGSSGHDLPKQAVHTALPHRVHSDVRAAPLPQESQPPRPAEYGELPMGCNRR
jgi:hypothetical protein